jgi:hypothetical protein
MLLPNCIKIFPRYPCADTIRITIHTDTAHGDVIDRLAHPTEQGATSIVKFGSHIKTISYIADYILLFLRHTLVGRQKPGSSPFLTSSRTNLIDCRNGEMYWSCSVGCRL